MGEGVLFELECGNNHDYSSIKVKVYYKWLILSLFCLHLFSIYSLEVGKTLEKLNKLFKKMLAFEILDHHSQTPFDNFYLNSDSVTMSFIKQPQHIRFKFFFVGRRRKSKTQTIYNAA